MSGRRERARPPSGRINIPRPGTANSRSSGNYGSNCSSARSPYPSARRDNGPSIGIAGSSPRPRPQSAFARPPSTGVNNNVETSKPYYGNSPRSSRDNLYNNNQIEQRVNNTGNYSDRSARSEASELSTNEVLRRMCEANDREKHIQQSKEIHALGDYNSFSRPRCSQEIPLRTVLLDPAVNNFPRSRTRTELMKRIKLSCAPHPSYDLDNDGYVSQEDYRLAKRFDFDGNGVLDAKERKVGKLVLAEEFFKRNANHLHIFGPNVAQRSHKKNVDNLVNSYSFERAYDKLISVERSAVGEGSKRITRILHADGDRGLCAHNYYTNKFDTTAWNDQDAIPRSTSQYGLSDHGGSRKRLLFSRTESMRAELQDRMQRTTFKNSNGGAGGSGSFGRINIITNPAVENS